MTLTYCIIYTNNTKLCYLYVLFLFQFYELQEQLNNYVRDLRAVSVRYNTSQRSTRLNQVTLAQVETYN